MTTPDVPRRRCALLAGFAALSVGLASPGCGGTVPEEGTLDARAGGLRPERVRGKAAPARPGASPKSDAPAP